MNILKAKTLYNNFPVISADPFWNIGRSIGDVDDSPSKNAVYKKIELSLRRKIHFDIKKELCMEVYLEAGYHEKH